MSIKKFLGRFLPVPARSFHKKIDDQNKMIKELSTKLEQLSIESRERCVSFETKYLRVQPQPRLNYFEYSIVDHCNLNCKGCSHFSPIASPRCIPLEDIKNDLHQMSLLTEKAVSMIRILGGEPLLHPDLPDILMSARKEFSYTKIYLTTNAVLLLKQPDIFWNVCRDNNIELEVTGYPINLDYNKMKKIAQSNDVIFNFFGNTGKEPRIFSKTVMDIKGKQDAKHSFWNCSRVNRCPCLIQGKIYPCPIIPNSTNFNEKFGTTMRMEKDDYLDIYSVDTIDEILLFISSVKPFCRYCKIGHSHKFSWEHSKQDIKEWT